MRFFEIRTPRAVFASFFLPARGDSAENGQDLTICCLRSTPVEKMMQGSSYASGQTPISGRTRGVRMAHPWL